MYFSEDSAAPQSLTFAVNWIQVCRHLDIVDQLLKEFTHWVNSLSYCNFPEFSVITE